MPPAFRAMPTAQATMIGFRTIDFATTPRPAGVSPIMRVRNQTASTLPSGIIAAIPTAASATPSGPYSGPAAAMPI